MKGRAALGLALVALLLAGDSCAPRSARDGAAESTTPDTAGAALKQKLADFEVALAGLRSVRWADHGMEWIARVDGGRVYEVRHLVRTGDGSADAQYDYEDGHLFAYRGTMTNVQKPRGAPAREVVTLTSFDRQGRLSYLGAAAAGRPLRLDESHREWWRAHILELANSVLEDTRRHVAG